MVRTLDDPGFEDGQDYEVALIAERDAAINACVALRAERDALLALVAEQMAIIARLQADLERAI